MTDPAGKALWSVNYRETFFTALAHVFWEVGCEKQRLTHDVSQKMNANAEIHTVVAIIQRTSERRRSGAASAVDAS